MRLGHFRIALIYFITSVSWITLSDKFLFLFQHTISTSAMLLLSSSKGYLFVVVSALLLIRLIKASEKKLLEGEKQYRSMYQDNVLPMWIYDPQTYRFISVNLAAIEKYGYTEQEFLQKTVFDIRPPEDHQKVIESAKTVSLSFRPSGVWRHYTKTGTALDVKISSQQITFNKQRHVLVIVQDITENIVLEKQLSNLNHELLEEKRKLSETQQMAKVAGWELCLKTKKLVWSDELYKLADTSSHSEKDPFEIYLEHIHEEDRPKMIRAMDQLITTGKNLDVTHRIKLLNGGVGYVHQTARLGYLDGKPYKVVGAMQDITEFKEMELEKNKYVYTLEDTLESMNESFYAINKDFIITKANRKFELETGLKNEEIIGRQYTDVFPGTEYRVTYQELKKVLNERVSVKFEAFSHSMKKWLHISAYPTHEGVAVYFTDITQQKEQDFKLQKAVERYELVAKATQDIIYEYNLCSQTVTYNNSVTKLRLWDSGEIDSSIDKWRSLIHPDDLPYVVKSQQEIIAGRQTNWNAEYRISSLNGEYKYVYDQGYFLYDDEKPVKLIGAVRDIDQLKKANEENRRLAEIITKVNNLIIVTDTEQRITWVNKAFEDYCGYSSDKLIGTFPTNFLSGPETSEEILAYIAESKKQRQTFSVELIHYIKYQKRWVNIEYTPLFDDCGKFKGYIAVHQDITLRKQKDELVKRQNKALQEIAWLSSHHIRKPVASILGLADLLADSKQNEEREELTRLIRTCAKEMDCIVHQISDKIQREVQVVEG